MSTGQDRALDRLLKRRRELDEIYKDTPNNPKPSRQVLRKAARDLSKDDVRHMKRMLRKAKRLGKKPNIDSTSTETTPAV